MRRSGFLAALVAAALAASPDPEHQRHARLMGPRPKKLNTGMRRASRRPWNDRENERRRRQIARGIIRPTDTEP